MAKKAPMRHRYKNEAFLKALGRHCRELREQRGYTLARMARESDQLSASSISRLENGTTDTQVLILVRYAEVLGLSILDLFSFLKESPNFLNDSRIIPYEEEIKPPLGYVPVFPLKVAAGLFSDEKSAESINPIGWVDAAIRGNTQDYFATFVRGESMQPRIEDGALCLFRKYLGGSRQGKIYLIQARGIKNSETGESFVVKKYVRQTSPRSSADAGPAIIHLVSENPRFSPMVLVGMSDDEIQIIAEFIKTL